MSKVQTSARLAPERDFRGHALDLANAYDQLIDRVKGLSYLMGVIAEAEDLDDWHKYAIRAVGASARDIWTNADAGSEFFSRKLGFAVGEPIAEN